MSHSRSLISAVLALLLTSLLLPAQTTLIKNVGLIDVENGRLLSGRNILIEGKNISRIGTATIAPPSDQTTIIDGSGQYLMPGMIDAHIHFFQTGGLYTRPDAIDLRSRVPYEEELAFAEAIIPDNFRRYLRLGVTTIIDVGGPFFNFKVRDSIAAAQLSPNVLVTGPLFSSYQPEALTTDDPPIIKVSSVEEVDALFDKMLPYRPDFIKVWYIVSRDLPADKTYPLVEHLSRRAKENGLKLSVHATQLETARLAVQAGADILVHSISSEVIPEEVIRELKAKEVTYIPTLIVSENYMKPFLAEPKRHPQDLRWANPAAYGSLMDLYALPEAEWPERIKRLRQNAEMYRNAAAHMDSIMAANLQRLVAAGVNVAAGTDAGNIGTLHASSYIQELEAMQRAGMTNAQILRAATINAARGFGRDAALGSIAEGKQADLLLLRENPLENLEHLSSISRVIRAGQVHDVSHLVEESPEMLVQRQLNAYNARDIDAFMATYADDIELYNFPNELTTSGQEQMRANYDRMFRNTPNLFCEIKNRIVLGNKVIDQEFVRFNEGFVEAVAVYEVEDGKIRKVTFLRK